MKMNLLMRLSKSWNMPLSSIHPFLKVIPQEELLAYEEANNERRFRPDREPTRSPNQTKLPCV